METTVHVPTEIWQVLTEGVRAGFTARALAHATGVPENIITHLDPYFRPHDYGYTLPWPQFIDRPLHTANDVASVALYLRWLRYRVPGVPAATAHGYEQWAEGFPGLDLATGADIEFAGWHALVLEAAHLEHADTMIPSSSSP